MEVSMTTAPAPTSEIMPAKNDWRLFVAELMIILALSALAGGWGFGALTGWPPVITGLTVAALYAWLCLYGRYGQENYINNIKRELVGLAVITFAEIVVFVGAAMVTAVIWLLSLIPQYFFGWVLPFGPTLFVVWLVLSVILWILDKVVPDPNREPDFI